jgi:hypothetical protein
MLCELSAICSCERTVVELHDSSESQGFSFHYSLAFPILCIPHADQAHGIGVWDALGLLVVRSVGNTNLL